MSKAHEVHFLALLYFIVLYFIVLFFIVLYFIDLTCIGKRYSNQENLISYSLITDYQLLIQFNSI